MTDKQIRIDGVLVQDCCYFDYENDGYEDSCYIHQNECSAQDCYYKQLKRKEKACKEWKEEYRAKIEELNELEEKLLHKEQECEELRRTITKIFACLIKANRSKKIIDTLWIDSITTLWDYIALTLGIEGDQTQIEEQILQKIS